MMKAKINAAMLLGIGAVTLALVGCSDSNNTPVTGTADTDITLPAGGGTTPVVPVLLEPMVTTEPPEILDTIDPVIRTEDEVFAFRENSKFGDALKTCNALPYEESEDDCTVELLPYIALENPAFTREDIMSRVLVSHRWMGRRFEQLLNDAPDTMIAMFGSATGVIISSDIRPADYRIWTGGIRIDPRYLWMTVPEKRTILVQDDFRNDYSRDLQFSFYSSLVKNNDWAIPYSSLESDDARSFSDIRLAFQSLMFHELAHANDFVPASVISQVDPSLTIVGAAQLLYENYGGSQALDQSMPLQSLELFELGGVSFWGNDATEAQKSVQPDYAGSLMYGDGATHFYSYSTIYEDFASAVEMAMMYYHHQVSLNIAFTVKPPGENFTCDDLKVGWGVRDRLANPTVNSRAQIALGRIFGPSEAGDFLASYSAREDLMSVGVGFCNNQFAPMIAGGPDSKQDARFLPRIPLYRRHNDVDFGTATRLQ